MKLNDLSRHGPDVRNDRPANVGSQRMRAMVRRIVRAFGVLCALSVFAVHAQVSVTTYHNDNLRTGQNTQETILAPSNVNSTQFGKLFTVTVDGYVVAQPLYLPNINI